MKKFPNRILVTQVGAVGSNVNAQAQHSAGREPLLDIAQLAERIHVSERFVRRLVLERRVPYVKIGHFVRFDSSAIEDWLDSCRAT